MSFGKCPEENNMVPFNKERFAGKWFEQVRDPENIYTMSADCVTMEFSQPQSEGRLDAYFRGFYWMMMSYQGGSRDECKRLVHLIFFLIVLFNIISL